MGIVHAFSIRVHLHTSSPIQTTEYVRVGGGGRIWHHASMPSCLHPNILSAPQPIHSMFVRVISTALY